MDIVPFVEGDVPVADDRGDSSNSLTVFQQPQSAVRSPAPRGSGRNRSDMEIVPVADGRSNSSNSVTVFQQPQPAGRSTAPRGRGSSKSIQNESVSSQSETRAIQLAGVSLAPRGRGHNRSVQNESVSSQSETRAIQLAGPSTATRGKGSSKNNATRAIQLAGPSTATGGKGSSKNNATSAIQLAVPSTAPRGREPKRLATNASISSQNKATKAIQLAGRSTSPRGKGSSKSNATKEIQLAGCSTAPRGREPKRLATNASISSQNKATKAIQLAGSSTAPRGKNLSKNNATRAIQSAGRSTAPKGREPKKLATNASISSQNKATKAIQLAGSSTAPRGKDSSKNNATKAIQLAGRSTAPKGREPKKLATNASISSQNKATKAIQLAGSSTAPRGKDSSKNNATKAIQLAGRSTAPKGREPKKLATNASISSQNKATKAIQLAGRSTAPRGREPKRLATNASISSQNKATKAIQLASRSTSPRGRGHKRLAQSRSISPQNIAAKKIQSARLSTAPIGRGHKTLVPNGRISPQNIAARAKQSAGKSSLQSNYVEPSQAWHPVSSNTMFPSSAHDIVAAERGGGRVNGKGLLIHPSSHGLNGGTIHNNNNRALSSSSRSRLLDLNDNNNLDAREQQLKADEILARELQEQLHHVDIFEDRGIAERLARELRPTDGLSNTSIDSHHISHPSNAGHSVSSNTISPIRVDDIVTGLNRGSIHTHDRASSSSSRIIVLDPEVVDLVLDDNNNNLDARARQLEEDEILARQLQEEQYSGDVFEDRWVDEPLARELRHEEGLPHTSTDVHNISHPELQHEEGLLHTFTDDVTAEERGGGRVKENEVVVHPSPHGLNGGTILTNNRASSSSSRGSVDPEVDARARQLEEDEILARELQEQYHGDIFEDRRVGEPLVRELQHADNLPLTSTDGHHISHPSHAGVSISSNMMSPISVDNILFHPSSHGLNGGNILTSNRASSSSSRGNGLDPEVVELGLPTRITGRLSENLNDNENNNLDAMGRQLEADEILAHALHEQQFLGHLFEGRGINEHLARELQYAESLQPTSISSHNISHPTFVPRENRLPRSQPHQNASNRRTVPQVPFSTGMSQLGSRMTSPLSTPITSSRGTQPQFPQDMDLDMDFEEDLEENEENEEDEEEFEEDEEDFEEHEENEEDEEDFEDDEEDFEEEFEEDEEDEEDEGDFEEEFEEGEENEEDFEEDAEDFEEEMETDHIVDVKIDITNDRNNDHKNVGNPRKRKKDFPSQNAPIFRRAKTENVCGLGATDSNGAERDNAFTGKCKREEPDFSHCGSRDNAIKVKKEAKACMGNSSTTSENAFTGKCKLEEPDFSHCGSSDNPIEVKKEAKACFGNSSTFKNAFTGDSGECKLEEPDFSHCGSRDNAIKVKKEAKSCMGNSSCTSENGFTGKCKLEEPDFSHCGFSDNPIEVKKEAKACLGNSFITFGDQVTAVTVVQLEDRTLSVPNTIGDQEVVKLLPPPKFVNGLSEDLEASRFLSKSHLCGPSSVIDLTVENGQFQQLEPDFSHSGSKDTAIEVRKEAKVCLGNSSITFGDQVTAITVVKLEDRTLPVPNTIGDQEVVKLLPPPKFVNGLSEDLEASRFPSKSHHWGAGSVIDLTVENGQFQQPEPDFSHFGSKDNAIVVKKEAKACLGNSSITFGDQVTAVTMVKLEDRTLPVPNTIGDQEVVKLLPPPKFVNKLSEDLEASRFPIKSHHCGPSSVIDLTEENGQFQQQEPDFSHSGSRGNAIEVKKERKSCFGSSSTTSKNAFTGNCKLEDTTLPVPITIGDQEVVELLSPPRFVNRLSEDLEDNANSCLDARARQLKTDEILARKLQEQMYHVDNFEDTGGEHVAWEQPHTECLPHTSIDNHLISHPRLDISEAVEDAVGDLNDMGMADDIFHAPHDFNENDYEMLSVLDEHHQHTGASASQINSLPTD